MCGITAVSGDKALFRACTTILGQLNRGTKGSGYAWLNEKSNIWFIKSPNHPLSLAVSQRFFINRKATVAIGHNRMPSKGGITESNCHPFFSCDASFALVHNGTVYGTDEIKTKLEKHKIGGETDSEVLTHMICEKISQGKTMKDALHDMITDTQLSSTVLILTNTGEIWGTRDTMPLHYVTVKDKQGKTTVVLGSEEEAIKNSIYDISVRNKEADIVWSRLETGDIIHVDTSRNVTVTHTEFNSKYRSYDAKTYTRNIFSDDYDDEGYTREFENWNARQRGSNCGNMLPDKTVTVNVGSDRSKDKELKLEECWVKLSDGSWIPMKAYNREQKKPNVEVC